MAPETSEPRDRIGRILAAIAAAYLFFALRTTRWRFDGEAEHLGLITREAVILAFWHERLLLMPAVWTIARDLVGRSAYLPPVNILVSRHRDGMMIARVVRRFGGGAIHGSSGRMKDGRMTDRGGAAAIRRSVTALRSGEHLAVTPDGPRGPARRAKDGLPLISSLSGRPVLACAARSRPFIRVPTWDRMILPLPFGRGVIALGAPFYPEREAIDVVEAAIDRVTRAVDDAF